MAVATVNYKVSPTVLSSDLFTPTREPRVTLPTIGIHTRESPPTGPHPWGGSLTTYGGTGALPILGTYRTRDLPFGRSHRHFGTGLAYHPAISPPYRLTALKLDGCRINDQRLTTSLKAEAVRTKWQREAWPGHEAYFSHRSIFDVFPSGEFSEEKAISAQHSVNPMSETTRAALMAVREQLYQKTLYRDSYGYRSGTSEPVFNCVTAYQGEVVNDNLLARISTYGKLREAAIPVDNSDEEQSTDEPEYEKPKTGNIDDISINRAEDHDDSRDDDTVTSLLDQLLHGERTHMQSTRHTLTDQAGKQDSLVPFNHRYSVPPPPPPPPTPPPPPSSPRPRVSRRSTILRNEDNPTRANNIDSKQGILRRISKESLLPVTEPAIAFELGDPVSGVGPCWPPSTSHVMDKIRGSQLLERREVSDFPEAYFSTLQPRCIVPELRTPACHRSSDYSPEVDECDAPRRCGERDGNHDFDIPAGRSPTPGARRTMRSELTNTGIPGAATIFLPPVPLSECLMPSGNGVAHRLGLRFMTEAQRRFHIMHPEEVPDLRSTKSFGKKYFFYGYHSSAIRG